MAHSHPSIVQELKRALIAAGFEIYRTRSDAVHLAERPRDNQMLDAGVSIRPGSTKVSTLAEVPYFEVFAVVRCQRSDFINETAEQLYQRVREFVRADLLARQYVEIEIREQPMLDPGNTSRVLDVWYEISFSRRVESFERMIAEVRFALSIEKCVLSSHDVNSTR